MTIAIPTNFGTGGSGLTPGGAGSPTLAAILIDHKAAIDAHVSATPAASAIVPVVTSFAGVLTSADNTVQKALDTLDDHNHSIRTGATTLEAGTKTATVSGLSAASRVLVGLVATGGTDGVKYEAAVNSPTYTLVTFRALTAAGALASADTSTLHYAVFG